MKHRYFILRLAALAVAAAVLTGVCAPSLAATFTDVAEDEWYSQYVDILTEYGLAQGYEDGSFQPQKTLKRGEFIALVNRALGKVTPSFDYVHWAVGHLASLIDMGVVMPDEIEMSADSLNSLITRYEMAVILARAAELLTGTIAADVSGSCGLTDYGSIPPQYREYVLKAYLGGILTGYSDGTFSGERTLTRAEATAVICRLLFPYMRQVPDTQPIQPETDKPLVTSRQPTSLGSAGGSGSQGEPGRNVSDEYDSYFARVEDAVGFMPRRMRNELLFGDSTKTRFDTPEEAEAHMVNISVRIWSKSGGEKVEKTIELTVNSGVAEDVKGIFELIFNGPEKYCILSIEAYSWTDSLTSEHNMGTAIDINPFANPYVDREGNILVGDYYDPDDEYSLTEDSDVVRAFAAYGWGWGGAGRWSSGALDYMHMSLGWT